MLVDEWLVHKVPMSIQVACFTWSGLPAGIIISVTLITREARWPHS